MSATLERNPVWKSGPMICSQTNLPALVSLKDLLVFLAHNGPSCHVKRLYQCDFCQHWHAETTAPDPSGNSSGTGRSHRHDEP